EALEQHALVVDEIDAGPRALVGREARRRDLELRRERATQDALDAYVARREAVQHDLDLEAHGVAELRLRRRGAAALELDTGPSGAALRLPRGEVARNRKVAA